MKTRPQKKTIGNKISSSSLFVLKQPSRHRASLLSLVRQLLSECFSGSPSSSSGGVFFFLSFCLFFFPESPPFPFTRQPVLLASLHFDIEKNPYTNSAPTFLVYKSSWNTLHLISINKKNKQIELRRWLNFTWITQFGYYYLLNLNRYQFYVEVISLIFLDFEPFWH
jgi:hypothetical protein